MENILNLNFINDLDSNLKDSHGLIQVILGPRQVGKTTTILDYLKTKHEGKYLFESIDLMFNPNASWMVEKWKEAAASNKILVIDEIQKFENWSEIIKKLWDESRRENKIIQCILLGSSSLEIQKGLTESLTGRFQLIPTYHWNFHESNKGYGLEFEDFLKFGGYPGSYPLIKRESEHNVWHQYVKNSIINTVIEKDILLFQKVKSPALFKQVFEIIISYPAQEISYTKLLGQIQEKGNVDLVKYYLSLFEGAFLIKILEKYSDKKVLIKSSSPKILLLAPCLYYLNVLSQYLPEEKGRVFELVVGAQLVRTGHALYYWRDGVNEVDFILKCGRNIYAIEVKSGRKKVANGLQKFMAKFNNPYVKAVIITPLNYFDFERSPLKFLENY